jgi:intracellular multiplication protein IcmJ
VALFPITLGVRRAPDAGSSSPLPPLDKKKAEKTLRRDDYTCRFCGFRAEQFQRIVPYEGAGDPPFATACGFCEQCLSLDRSGLAGSAILIWLPEITQVDLHHVMRAVYVARSAPAGVMTDAATRTLETLTARRGDAKKRLGTDDPLLLATVMHESLSTGEYDQLSNKIDGVRLLPLDRHLVHTAKGNINQFPQMVKFWQSASGPFAKSPVAQWGDMFKTATGVAGNA